MVYLNNYTDNGAEIYKFFNAEELSLVVISDLDWNNDLSPWECPPVFKGEQPFGENADHYLRVLTEEIIPEAEKQIAGTPVWRGIAGYSLAGLFAIYAAYKTDVFTRFASVSGSLWFPKFKEFAMKTKMKITPECMYFSVGDKERKARNKLLQSVQQNTEKLEKFYRDCGVRTIFELNPGNHFTNAEERLARGISWITSDGN